MLTIVYCNKSNDSDKSISNKNIKNNEPKNKTKNNPNEDTSGKIFDNIPLQKDFKTLPFNAKTILRFSPKALFKDRPFLMSNEAKIWDSYFEKLGIDLKRDIEVLYAASPLSIVDFRDDFIANIYGNFPPDLEKNLSKIAREESDLPIINKKPSVENIDGMLTFTNPIEGITIGFADKNTIFACSHYRIKETISLLRNNEDKNITDNEKMNEYINELKDYSSFLMIGDVEDKAKEILKGFAFADTQYKTLQQILGNMKLIKIGTKYDNGMEIYIGIELSSEDIASDFTDRINTELMLLRPSSPLTKKLIPLIKFEEDDTESICKLSLNKQEWEDITKSVFGDKKEDKKTKK